MPTFARALRPALPLLALSLVACGGKAVIDPPLGAGGAGGSVASAGGASPGPVCVEHVCLDAAARARLDDAQVGVAACAPDPSSTDGPGDGLRIGSIAVPIVTAETVTLRMLLVNTSPASVGTYPGIRLEIARGGGTTATMDVGQFYALPGCAALDAEVTLDWSLVEAADLRAEATNNLGSTVVDAVPFTLQR